MALGFVESLFVILSAILLWYLAIKFYYGVDLVQIPLKSGTHHWAPGN